MLIYQINNNSHKGQLDNETKTELSKYGIDIEDIDASSMSFITSMRIATACKKAKPDLVIVDCNKNAIAAISARELARKRGQDFAIAMRVTKNDTVPTAIPKEIRNEVDTWLFDDETTKTVWEGIANPEGCHIEANTERSKVAANTERSKVVTDYERNQVEANTERSKVAANTERSKVVKDYERNQVEANRERNQVVGRPLHVLHVEQKADSNTLIYVGELEKCENLTAIITAIANLDAELRPGVRVCGTGKARYVMPVVKRTRIMGLNVEWLGDEYNVTDEITNAAGFILSDTPYSTDEIRAMAAGLPEVTADNLTEWLDAEKRKNMSQKAIETYNDNHDPRNVAKRLTEIINKYRK